MRFSLVAILVLAAAPEFSRAGGELNCADPVTQMDMNECAALAYQEADAALNATWKDIMPDLRERAPGAADTLREGQRLWISFRDKTCEAEAQLFEGGSIRPLIHAECLKRLTEQREKDLREIFSPR